MSEIAIPSDIRETARQRLQTLGQRVTPARLATLATLLDSPNALSHHEVAAKIAANGELCDRVTLYRVLEWLVERGLAHKVAGDDRSWRFGAILDENHQHPHFCCLRCGKMLCLDTLRPSLILGLPAGYTFQRAEITIQGTCPDCSC